MAAVELGYDGGAAATELAKETLSIGLVLDESPDAAGTAGMELLVQWNPVVGFGWRTLEVQFVALRFEGASVERMIERDVVDGPTVVEFWNGAVPVRIGEDVRGASVVEFMKELKLEVAAEEFAGRLVGRTVAAEEVVSSSQSSPS